MLAGAAAARAEDRPLRYDLRADVPITIGAAAMVGVLQIAQSSLVPRACRWCDRGDDGKDELNGVDRAVHDGLRWDNREAANRLSSALAYGLAPLWLIGLDVSAAAHEHNVTDAPVDVLLMAEATFSSAAVNQIVKILVARERPYAHDLAPSERALRYDGSPDSRLSFYSGHTNLMFSVATAAGTIASMRGYRFAPAIWGVGEGFAAITGYLRIACNRHYFTDVVAGALIGSAFGFAIPYFAHRPKEATLQASTPLSSPVTFDLRGTF